MITISIIIANYNGEKFIKDCILSILKEKSDSYEIIVVDDISTDNSVKIIKNAFGTEKKVKLYISRKKNGSAGTRNIGAQHATGKYLFFLDLDTTVQKGWHREIVDYFTIHKNTGVAQPKILIKDTEKFDYAGDLLGPFGFLIERSLSAKDAGQFDRPDLIFSMKGAGMIMRAKTFQEVRGFDKDYEYLWEEPDLTWRAWLRGYEVRFLPSVTIWHAYGAKKKQYYFDNKVFYRGCRNTITTHIKNLGTINLFKILPLNIFCWLLLSLLFLIKFDFPKSWALLMGIASNILILPKTLKKRRTIQRNRRINDEYLFSKVGDKKSMGYYVNKAYTYIWQK